MTTTETQVATPHYMLRNKDQCLGPICLPSQKGVECVAFYGFSNKSSFDVFCRNSSLELTPYPLVKVFLRDQQTTVTGGLRLLVLDAGQPNVFQLLAATTEAILNAHENHETRLLPTHALTFDQGAGGYRVGEISA